jgi:hypothetical protein
MRDVRRLAPFPLYSAFLDGSATGKPCRGGLFADEPHKRLDIRMAPNRDDRIQLARERPVVEKDTQMRVTGAAKRERAVGPFAAAFGREMMQRDEAFGDLTLTKLASRHVRCGWHRFR